MFSGDWVKRRPHLGGFGVVAAILISCLVVGVVAFSEGRQSQREEQQSKTAGDASKDNKTKRAQQSDTPHAGVPALAEALISNPEPADTHEREKRDLAAQENTAAWAFWMAAFTAIQVVMSGAGLGALIITIQQGQSALETARAANKTSSDEFRQAYKPFLHIELFGPIVDPTNASAAGKERTAEYRVSVRVTNRSHAIAKMLFYRVCSYEDFKAGGIIPLTPVNTVLEHGQSTFLATPEANQGLKAATVDIDGMDPIKRFDFMRRKGISSHFHSETVDYGAGHPHSPPIVVRLHYEDALGVRRIMHRCYAAKNDKGGTFYECGGPLINYEKEEKRG